MKDFSTYKFRPSSLGRLMTNGRSKSEILSETTKSYLKEIYIEEMYGRRKDISNKFTEKGILCEEDSLDLVTAYYGKLFIKNKDKIENTFIHGTPDIILPEKIIDIKSSWDIWTFSNADGNKDYWWQLQGYMWLTSKKTSDLVYCLNNSPEHLIFQEQKKKMYQLGLVDQEGTPEFIEMEKEVEKNMKFDDIEASERIKVFSYDYDDEAIDEVRERIKVAREYLNKITL